MGRHLYDSSSTSGFESSEQIREALLLTVDYAVHKVIGELKEAGMFDNSIVLVTTDNGGETWDSNLPLRGTKDTVYEGGIRGASFIMSPLLPKKKLQFQWTHSPCGLGSHSSSSCRFACTKRPRWHFDVGQSDTQQNLKTGNNISQY